MPFVSLGSHVASPPMRTKILSSFAAVLLSLSVLGATSLTRSAATDDAVADLDSGLAGVAALATMRASLGAFHATVSREVALAGDGAAREESQRKLASFVRAYEDASSGYRPAPEAGTRARLYASVMNSAGAYMDAYDDLKDLLDSGKYGEANELVTRRLSPGAEAFDASLAVLLDFDTAALRGRVAAIGREQRAGRLTVAGLLALGLVVACLGCVWLTRDSGGGARRGQAGIAAELKDIASRSVGATEAIAERITRLEQATGEALKAIGAISGALAGEAERQDAAIARVTAAAEALAIHAEPLSADAGRSGAEARGASR